jgi:hypothetical protein
LAWYQGAVLLAGIGLAGIFPKEWLSAAVALFAAPVLADVVETCFQIARDPACCNLWPFGLAAVFFSSLPAPFIGFGIGRLLTKTGLPRRAYAGVLMSALAIGALMPLIQDAAEKRLETKIPGILNQIHDAEMAYSAGRPDGSFTCDGTQLPGAAGRLGWWRNGKEGWLNLNNIQPYYIQLDCSQDGGRGGFIVRAQTGNGTNPAPAFSIDQTGKLVVMRHR